MQLRGRRAYSGQGKREVICTSKSLFVFGCEEREEEHGDGGCRSCPYALCASLSRPCSLTLPTPAHPFILRSQPARARRDSSARAKPLYLIRSPESRNLPLAASLCSHTLDSWCFFSLFLVTSFPFSVQPLLHASCVVLASQAAGSETESFLGFEFLDRTCTPSQSSGPCSKSS